MNLGASISTQVVPATQQKMCQSTALLTSGIAKHDQSDVLQGVSVRVQYTRASHDGVVGTKAGFVTREKAGQDARGKIQFGRAYTQPRSEVSPMPIV